MSGTAREVLDLQYKKALELYKQEYEEQHPSWSSRRCARAAARAVAAMERRQK